MKQNDRTFRLGAIPTTSRQSRGSPGPLLWIAVCATLALAGCGSTPKAPSSSGSGGGGYYKDDGPPANPPANLDQVQDPLPAVEPLASGPNRPYVIFGKRYVPRTSLQPYKVRGIASWYGRKFHGARTSNGEIYDMYAMTAAHTTLPIPSYARVTRVATGKSIIVRVNDRGPFHDNRVIDLSYTAAYKLGLLAQGSGEVEVELLMPEEIARIRAERESGPMLASAPGAPASADTAAETVALPVAVQASSAPVRELPPLVAASNPPPSTGAAPNPAAATGVAVPASSAMPVAAMPQSGVYLQVGAFSGQRNAEDLLARLRSQLADWTEPLSIVNTGSLHRIHIGPYPTRESAQAAAQRLQARVDISPVIVVR
ncbi:MAG: septal ring lytic transglycosylase RlpA family protein [Pigmentiphaga sp.]|uniref:septal ring lytic transglycosylase RlpA family protein n=1 Tax=Pigmentiphaga sp. TaxID=1977564 RepID=UPI0029AF9A9D|nr:septal ring lytic transglycosylase RlpA family protein [Pigmentiphaga sp.]MDX3907885.1 septal ring lytic transglycosylase RlpA family protein [Pigmentiphaga sp.]